MAEDIDPVLTQVRGIVASKLCLNPLQNPLQVMVTPLTDLGADTLDAVEIVLEIEELFHVDMNDTIVPQTLTMIDLVEQVHMARKNRNAAT